MNQEHQKSIIELQQKRKKKKKIENIRVFSVLITLFIIVVFINKYYANEMIFMFMFFIAGVLCFNTAIKNILHQYEVRKWQKIDCTVIKKELLKKYGFINYFMIQSVVPIIYFSFTINENVYFSDTVHLGTSSSTNEEKWKQIDNKYLVGFNYKCYVNPKNINQAVLETFVDWEYFRFYIFFGLFFWGTILYYFFSK